MANTKITNPELFNLGDSTSATQLPVMTTAERIAMNVPQTFTIDYLVVAGGGAGGGYYRGGGGGAGELKESASSIDLSAGYTYDVAVGAGGVGVVVGSDNGSNGNNGDNSTFHNITSLGGGGGSPGDSSSGNTGSDGGSGGGAGGNWGGAAANGGSATGTGLGNNGGAGAVVQCGGGGGGATQPGFTAGTSGTAGDGGAGKTYTAATSITGQAFSIAGGGGGANYGSGNITVGGIGGGAAGASGSSPYTSGPSAANNTGGGGGGGNGISPQGAGGDGGSGIVILRYATADVSSYAITGITPTETTDGTDTILSFTTVGTGTINFTSSTSTGTTSTGEMIFNSTTDKVEYWDGTKWYGITYAAPAVLFQSPATSMLGTSNQANFGAYTLSNSNRTFLATGSGNSGSGVFLGSDILPNTGKYYWESVRNAKGGNPYYYNYHDLYAYQSSGTLISTGTNAIGNRIAYGSIGISGSTNGWYYRRVNTSTINTNPSTPFVSFSGSEVWSYRFDTDTKLFETFRNGSPFSNSAVTVGTATYYQFILQARPGGQATANLQQSDWVYDPATL